MKIFLSWSGDLSLKIAVAFRDWLPSVIQAVKPYVSSEDIDKGTRWSTDIAKELEASSYGILCITATNMMAPWIAFEAGALSKAIDKANVSPFLYNIKRSDVQGPLLQFQSTINEKDDVARLIASINRRLPSDDKLEDALLLRSFEVWWPQLKEQLDALPPEPAAPTTSVNPAGGKNETILEELLDLARNQQKLLRSPEALLPADYLEYILRSRHMLREREDPRASELHEAAIALEELLGELRASIPDAVAASRVQQHLETFHELTHRLTRRRLRPRPPVLIEKKTE